VSAHALAQQAVVRMLFDPAFAARVRAQPDDTLPQLPSELRAQLAAIDPRALRLDRLRGRRLLRTLFDEYKASTTLVLARRQKLAFLDGFFAAEFADAVAGARLLHDAYAAFLARAEPSLTALVGIEGGLARARRRGPPPRDGRVHLAPGVEPIAATVGALAALQEAEQYLFEVGLMPAVALCDDAPPLGLDDRARDDTPLYLVAVPTEAGCSLVTIDAPLHQALTSLPRPWAPSLQPLVDDELAVRT
jgi:hypothetical protein